MDDEVLGLIQGAPAPDDVAKANVAARIGDILRPPGALARLDEIAIWLAGWQRTEVPSVDRPGLAVFVADHGVARDGVSAFPSEVTASMLEVLRKGRATANAMADVIGAEVVVVDVGVGKPTANIAERPALDPGRFKECFDTGRATVRDLAPDLLVLGEMGIANTTAAAAVTAVLLGRPAEECTGLGTGIDAEVHGRKVNAVRAAVAQNSDSSPMEVLRKLGGSELAAMAGAAIQARIDSIPVVLDGFVVTAAVAPLEQTKKGALDNCIAGHVSSEPGHRLLLDYLGKTPLIDLDLRLGEGSGALLAVPLIRMAASSATKVGTFSEWGLKKE